MKLIIQIPCYNEELTLPITFRDLPHQIDGVDLIEILIVDDGSTDNTADVARKLGVHHIVSFASNQGLARAFAAGLDACLSLGADIIVNTDADNQYRGQDIEKLVQPILQGKSDIVVGIRNIDTMQEFSFLKIKLQRIGSFFIRRISHSQILDTTSGFRAYNREAAIRTNVFSYFTYTLETLIQAGMIGLKITGVPILTNKKLRDSRLFSSTAEYLGRSMTSIIRIYTMYNPLKVFSTIAGIFASAGLALIARFLYYYFTLINVQTGHIQSLIAAAVLIMIGFQIFLFGLLADITANNRKILEEILLRMKKMELGSSDNQ